MNPAYHPAPSGGRTAEDQTFLKESFDPAPREEKQDAPKPDIATQPADVDYTYSGPNPDDSEMTSMRERCLRLQAAGVDIGAQNQALELKNMKNKEIMQNSRNSNVVCVCGIGQRAVNKDQVGEIVIDSNRSEQGEGSPGQSKKDKASRMKGRKSKRVDGKTEQKSAYQKQTLLKEKYGQSFLDVEKQDAEKSETSPKQTRHQAVQVGWMQTTSDAKPEQNLLRMPYKPVFVKSTVTLTGKRPADKRTIEDEEPVKKAMRKSEYLREGTSKRKDVINHKESQPEEKEVDVCDGELPSELPEAKLSNKMPEGEFLNKMPEIELSKKVPEVELSNKMPEVELSNKMPEVELSNKMPEGELSKKMPEGQISNKMPEIELSKTLPEGEISNKMPKVELSKKLPEGEIQNKVPEGDISNKVPEIEISNKMLEGELSNTMPEGDISNKVPERELSNKMPEGELSNKMPEGQLSSKMPAGELSRKMSEGELSHNNLKNKRIETGEQQDCPHVEICTRTKADKDSKNMAKMLASQHNQLKINKNSYNCYLQKNNSNKNLEDMLASEHKLGNKDLPNNISSNNNDLLNTLYRGITRRCGADKRMLLVYEIVLHNTDNIQIAYKVEDGPNHLLPNKLHQATGKVEDEVMSKGQLDQTKNEKKGDKQEVNETNPVETDPISSHLEGDMYEKPDLQEKILISCSKVTVTDPKVTDPKVTHPKVKSPNVRIPEVTHPKVKGPKVTHPKVKDPKVKGPKATQPKVTHPKVKGPKVTHPKVKGPKLRGPKVTSSGDPSTVKQCHRSTRRGRRSGGHSRCGRRRNKKNKHTSTSYKKAMADQSEPYESPVESEKGAASNGSGFGNQKSNKSKPWFPKYNKTSPGGSKGTRSAYIARDQPPHHSNSQRSSNNQTKHSSDPSRNQAANAKTTPYQHSSLEPGSSKTATVRRRASSENPVGDSASGGGDGEKVGRGRPCSNLPPGSSNTGAIGGGREQQQQQNGLSDNGESEKGKDGNGSRRGSDQSPNQEDQTDAGGGGGEDDGDAWRDGSKGQEGGGGNGGGEKGGEREEGREGVRGDQRDDVVERNGPISNPHPWPPPNIQGAGGGASCGIGARPKDTKKRLGQDHCQGPYKDYYCLLKSKRQKAGASRDDLNRACSELEKCLVKCLHRDKDKQCAACGLLHAALKHVAKCPKSFWTECRECSPVADVLIYHVEVCLAHTYAAPVVGGCVDRGRVCRNNLKLCRNLVYKITDRCARVAPHEQTGHTFKHAIEEVWRTPGVWTRIKTYLRKVFDISLALNDSPPEAFQSGFGDQLISVPNFISVQIASMRELSILSSIALQQIIAAGNETEDRSQAGQEYHSGYSSSQEWELQAQSSDNVKYGTQKDLIAVGQKWKQQKESRSRPGCSTKHVREEDEMEYGVILAQHARDMKVQYPGGRYRRGVQWELGPVLGAGMSGRCSLALDSNTGFKFCVKEVILDKFELTEMEILTRLRHPGICLCYGAVLIGDSIYMFMEYVEGCSLQSHIAGLTRLNDMTALVYFKQLIQVLQYLQNQGILHEDIKSENILLRSGTTRLVLIDFGLARQVPSTYPQVAANESPVGSQTQWSPEKAECLGYGFPSDVWAAACVLLEMVTGSPPWLKRFSQAASLIFVIPTNAPPLADIHDYVSESMRDLIVWLWTMDPEHRPVPEDILQHRAFSMIDTSIVNRVIQNRSILTSGSPRPIDVQDDSHIGRNNTASIGSAPHRSGEVSPIERQSSSSSSSSNDASRYPSSLMSRVEDIKTVSTPREPARRGQDGQSTSVTGEQLGEASGGHVSLDGGNRLKYQPESHPGQGAVSGGMQDRIAGPAADDITPRASTTVTPTYSQSGLNVNVQPPFAPFMAPTPAFQSAPRGVLPEPPIPNLSIFDKENDSFHSSGSSVDLEKLMREAAAGGGAVGGAPASRGADECSDDEINDVQINSSHSGRPDMGVLMQGSMPHGTPDASGLHVDVYKRDRKSSGRQSQSDSDIQSEYRELQNGLLTRAMSDHLSLLGDEFDDLREETEVCYGDDLPSMTLSQNPPAAPTIAANPHVEVDDADGVLVVFVNNETRQELCSLRIYHVAEWENLVRRASARIQPYFQDGYCVRPVGETILDLSTSLNMNVPRIELEVWDYSGEEDWYVKDNQIMNSPHYMGAFTTQ